MEARHDDGPRMGQCYPCPVSNQDEFVSASFNRRLVAVSIDWFMCLAVSALIPLDKTQGSTLVPLAFFFFEVFFLTTLQGASAGQRLLRLKVVDSETGMLLTPGIVAFRTLLICLVVPVFLRVRGIGYHDRMCQSRVIRR
jgi:uncharacterized RDD family membrane protein YckC